MSKNNKNFFNRYIKYFFVIFGLLLIAVFMISLLTFRKTIFNLDPLINGIPQSKIASDIRIDLIKNKKALEITFNTKDGITLSGLAFLRSRPIANLIVCHGYRGCKESLYRFVDHFPDFNLLLFDFRAHGQSFGDFTSIGYFESNDVIAATEFFKVFTSKQNSTFDSKQNGMPMILLGLSMGGAAILKAVDKDSSICNAIILDSAYADLYSEIIHALKFKSGLPQIPFVWIMQKIGNWYSCVDITNVKPSEYIRSLKIPVFIIHSVEDEVTPTNDALKLYLNALKTERNAHIWIAPPCKHPKLHILFSDIYKKKVLSFLRRFKIC